MTSLCKHTCPTRQETAGQHARASHEPQSLRSEETAHCQPNMNVSHNNHRRTEGEAAIALPLNRRCVFDPQQQLAYA
eukprot:463892-Pleurochrysis_carterae.AAC.2